MQALSPKLQPTHAAIALLIVHHAMMGSKMRLLDDPEAITGLLDALLSEIDLLRSGRTQPNDPQDHAAIISDDSLNFAGSLVAASAQKHGDWFLREPTKVVALFKQLAVHLHRLDFLVPLPDPDEIGEKAWIEKRAEQMKLQNLVGDIGFCIHNKPYGACWLCDVAKSEGMPTSL
jgi:hypothetical protein